MGRLSRPVGLPIGPNGDLVPGTLVMNDNGDAEWFAGTGLGQQSTPTFTSNASDNYKWVSSPNCVDGVTCPTTTQRDLFYGNNSSETTLNNARLETWNSPTGYNSPSKAKSLNVPGTTNTATTTDSSLTEAQREALNVKPIEFEFEGKSRDSYGNYYYPLSIKNNKQDVIRFSIKKPGKVTFNPRFGEKTITRTYNQTFGSVTLPIQPTISDSNTVDWSGLQLNALEAYAAGASINLASSKTPTELFDKGGFMLKDIVSKITTDKKYQTALNVAIAQEAVGIQGLLSRATGGILNPNLELLFNGPQLRAFSFTFKMSPRSEKEATQVRNIIRFFKQGMSVKRTSSEVFLKSPHVFDVEYKTYDVNGVEKKHPSINKIKTCALIGCDVDYTPDGTYMTFNDPARTMTSYQISLRFSELEPVYDNDYNVFANDDVGY